MRKTKNHLNQILRIGKTNKRLSQDEYYNRYKADTLDNLYINSNSNTFANSDMELTQLLPDKKTRDNFEQKYIYEHDKKKTFTSTNRSVTPNHMSKSLRLKNFLVNKNDTAANPYYKYDKLAKTYHYKYDKLAKTYHDGDGTVYDMVNDLGEHREMIEKTKSI